MEKIISLLAFIGINGIRYVPRMVNRAAHIVAGFVARENGHDCWLGVGPAWLMDIIFDDKSVTEVLAREECREHVSTTA